MKISDMKKRSVEVREKYDQLSLNTGKKIWTRLQLAQGLAGDVGDLQKIITAKEGLRFMDNIDEKLKHELMDCLWVILVLTDKYNIDIENAFTNSMLLLENKIDNHETNRKRKN